MVPVALISIAANLIFLLMNTDSNGYTFYNTIASQILGSSIGAINLSITTAIGSIFYNDFPYLLSVLYSPITTLTEDMSLVGLVTQSIHGLMQLILPTSVILAAGLTFFKISYTDWLKNLWKLFLGFLASIIIILILFAVLV
jgi:uncharacterized ion transporter superfamily protein YfcC